MDKKSLQQVLGFLSTPPLWKNNLFGLSQFNFPLDISAEDAAISGSPHSILGKRMESFFEALLKSSTGYEVLASNIQIQNAKITIGEIDFLLKSLTKNQHYHVELVYKFYVYDPDYQEELERWIGPNRKDSLLQKIKKLKEKQFPLLYKPETKEYLSALQVNPQDLKQEVCFKAQLFLPKHLMQIETSSINKECVAGYWIHSEDFFGKDYEHYLFYSPKKQQWPVDPQYAENWHSYEVIKKEVETFIERKRSPLLWMKKSEFEFERFFIVWW
ncbi:DUF1853 family protein [Autumnicola psychrophila]|uniref:DUF1853 family protein n=1 Tax=Autumnicola psychrophila TaxID=3075592 RepID=A0ABU3DPM3_9FLAO|nr:DUF1853 family protein [Zunongwangia sp. F225]MDT0685666.1 DUF1853 family protein [Zunongwangia sp. F225]